MTKENAHLYLPLVQALADGKTIQFKTAEGSWDDFQDGVVFGNAPEHYRIKPEPREWRIWVSNDGRIREDSSRSAPHLSPGWEKISVREVLD